jgi:hypothetical protein
LNDAQELTYDDWVHGIRDGRTYCTDGLTHLFDYQVNGLGVGQPGADGRASVLAVKSGVPLQVSVSAAALLEEQPRDDIRNEPLDHKPYWHVERARVGDTRKVPVELIVNGVAVEKQELLADGHIEQIKFNYTPNQSSWVALRVFASCHTNPVFVEVDGQPIRASKKSADWCLRAVDVCWKQKEPQIRESEKAAAAQAYEAARVAYRKILAEARD